jgi:hypothetical protein
LPIVKTKDEVKKSSAWTKEGKREREMSLLILPRPERVTMPAAILPRPDKKKFGGKVKKEIPPTVEKVESTDDVSPPEVAKVESPTDIVPPIESVAVVKETSSIEPPATPETKNSETETAALLLRLVNLLRNDEKALGNLKSLVDGLAPKESSDAVAEKIVPSEHIESTETSMSNNVPPSPPTPPSEDIPTAIVVESQTPDDAVELQPPAVVEITTEKSLKVVHPEIIVYPTRKSKDRSKSKERSHKHKSKHSKHSKDFIALISAAADSPTVPQGFTAVAAVDIVDEELTRDELWYHVPETKDHDDVDVSPTGVYTLQDLKNNAHRATGQVKKLYEPPPFPITKGKTLAPYDRGSGSTDAYDATFQKVDAKDDLGVMSKPKIDPPVVVCRVVV